MITSLFFQPKHSLDSKHAHQENIGKIKSTLTSKSLFFKRYYLLSFWLGLKSCLQLIPNILFGGKIRFFPSTPSYPYCISGNPSHAHIQQVVYSSPLK